METSLDVAGLASAAAGRLINLLTTEGWAKIKTSVLSMWRHSHQERVEADLTEARGELLRAEQAGDSAELQGLFVAEWQARLARLIATRPDVVEQLRVLLLEESRGSGTPVQQASTTQKAHVTGGGDAYLAGRDMTVTKGRPA